MALFNNRNFKLKEDGRIRSTIKTSHERTKQYRDRTITDGIFSGGAYQLNRINDFGNTATMGSAGGSTIVGS